MILGDPRDTAVAVTPGARATLDDLFRRAAQRHPGMLALADPPNRAQFTDGVPRRLSYAQADRVISAIAERLHGIGLPVDSIVGIQLPNTVDYALALLGVLRAGMVAAPLPLLWRHSELVSALGRADAKALITCRRAGATDLTDMAMQAAADVFRIRHVCAFGADIPDGVTALDDLYERDNPQPPRLDEARAGNRAAHLAMLTWETTAESVVPVARNHAELIAGGLAVMLEGGFDKDTVYLSALPPSSFAGLSVAMLPWLITGGTLMLHHAFDAETLAQQLRERCDAVVLPASVLPRLHEAGFFLANLRSVVGVWRAPERMNNAPAWPEQSAACIDVACFGEAGVIPARRAASGKATPLPLGIVTAPRDAPGAVPVAETGQSVKRTLVLSGPMVPRHAFPPGVEETGLPFFRTTDGVVDTGYPCRADQDARSLTLTGPPAGIAGVGGYRFGLRDLQSLAGAFDPECRIAALPDSFSGHHLIGAADDKAGLREALMRHGVNPLVAEAFGA